MNRKSENRKSDIYIRPSGVGQRTESESLKNWKLIERAPESVTPCVSCVSSWILSASCEGSCAVCCGPPGWCVVAFCFVCCAVWSALSGVRRIEAEQFDLFMLFCCGAKRRHLTYQRSFPGNHNHVVSDARQSYSEYPFSICRSTHSISMVTYIANVLFGVWKSSKSRRYLIFKDHAIYLSRLPSRNKQTCRTANLRNTTMS